MYSKILVPLDVSPADQAIISHLGKFAKHCNAKLLLLHVADGFVARNQKKLNLSDSEEMTKDREYLSQKVEEFKAEGIEASFILATGEPSREILRIAEEERCDLIAMATHGHRWLADLIFGSVAENIRHRTEIPILMLRA